jgi:hypothetical protein
MSTIDCSAVKIPKCRGIRCVGTYLEWGKTKDVHKILVGKPLEKRPLRRPRRYEDNIKMDMRE